VEVNRVIGKVVYSGTNVLRIAMYVSIGSAIVFTVLRIAYVARRRQRRTPIAEYVGTG
jgi:hypothetical protein